jgi:hypothetical protein
MGRLVLAACALFAFIVGAKADDATDLLFFSGELISGRTYAGLGWLHAVSGLDASGFVFSAEGGEPQWRQVFAAGQAGWRFAGPGLAATFMGGLEADPRLHPLASADLWLEPTPHWMVQGRFEAASDWTSWRVATGWRPGENWPWMGPEAAASAAWPRVGLHATGLALPCGVEARVSAGVSWREGRRAGPYAEVSAWKRF